MNTRYLFTLFLKCFVVLHYQDTATDSSKFWSFSCPVCRVFAFDSFSGMGVTLESSWDGVFGSLLWTAAGDRFPGLTMIHCLTTGFPLTVLGLQLSRSYSSWAFCIFRFFILLLWKWKVTMEINMIPMINAMSTKSTAVDENDWNSWSICSMQVPLVWAVPLKVQCGMESATFSDVLVPI